MSLTPQSSLERKLLQLPGSVRTRILQWSYAPDCVRALTDEPHTCGGCGEPHYMFVSRDGVSVCYHCDAQRQAAKGAADRARIERGTHGRS